MKKFLLVKFAIVFRRDLKSNQLAFFNFVPRIDAKTKVNWSPKNAHSVYSAVSAVAYSQLPKRNFLLFSAALSLRDIKKKYIPIFYVKTRCTRPTYELEQIFSRSWCSRSRRRYEVRVTGRRDDERRVTFFRCSGSKKIEYRLRNNWNIRSSEKDKKKNSSHETKMKVPKYWRQQQGIVNLDTILRSPWHTRHVLPRVTCTGMISFYYSR